MQKKFLMTAVAMVSLCLGGVASAGEAAWTGDFSSSLFDQYNWAPELVPVAGDILSIRPGSYYEPLFDTGVQKNMAYVGVDAGGSLTITSGTMRLTGNSSSECLFDRSGSITTGGTLINGGTLSCTSNLYAGKGNVLGRITITSGSIVTGTTTLGYQVNSETEIGGVLNIWGGTVNLGTLLRMDPTISLSGIGKECSGRIDIRTPGVATLRLGTLLDYDGVKGLIGKGRIVSEPGYAPIAVLLADPNYVQITAQKVYYATNPSPVAFGTHQTLSAAQVLSWVKPLPRVPGDVVTSNVYFGTTNPPTTPVGTAGQADAFVTVTTLPEKTYYWKVDSFDPNGGITIPTPANAVWTFDTIIAPTVTVGYGGTQAAMRVSSSPADVNAVATLVATVTDDGYPVSPLELVWSDKGGYTDPNAAATFDDPHALNPVATFTRPGTTYTLKLTAFDGGRNASADLSVKIFEMGDNCNAAKYKTTYEALAGDVNTDCAVDAKDLAVLVDEWLECNSLDCL